MDDDENKSDKLVPNQNYVFMTFLSPEDENIDDSLQETKQKTNIIIKKIFTTKEEADEYAKYCNKVDPNFNHYVVDYVVDVEESDQDD